MCRIVLYREFGTVQGRRDTKFRYFIGTPSREHTRRKATGTAPESISCDGRGSLIALDPAPHHRTGLAAAKKGARNWSPATRRQWAMGNGQWGNGQNGEWEGMNEDGQRRGCESMKERPPENVSTHLSTPQSLQPGSKVCTYRTRHPGLVISCRKPPYRVPHGTRPAASQSPVIKGQGRPMPRFASAPLQPGRLHWSRGGVAQHQHLVGASSPRWEPETVYCRRQALTVISSRQEPMAIGSDGPGRGFRRNG